MHQVVEQLRESLTYDDLQEVVRWSIDRFGGQRFELTQLPGPGGERTEMVRATRKHKFREPRHHDYGGNRGAHGHDFHRHSRNWNWRSNEQELELSMQRHATSYIQEGCEVAFVDTVAASHEGCHRASRL